MINQQESYNFNIQPDVIDELYRLLIDGNKDVFIENFHKKLHLFSHHLRY